MVVQHSWQLTFEETEQMEICCAWCGRFRNPDHSWVEPSSSRSLELTTHGICPSCMAEMAEAEELRRS